MALTAVTVTAAFTRPDGHPAAGSLSATLSGAIVNGAAQVDPTPIRGILVAGVLMDDSGLAPFKLYANDDPGTLPAGTSYLFVLELDCAALEPFSAVIPHTAAAGTIDLSALR